MLGFGQLRSSLLRVARMIQRVRQPIALLATAPKASGGLLAHLTCRGLGLQGLSLRIFAGCSVSQFIRELGFGQGNRVALFPLGQLHPIVQLFVKVTIAHLLEDVGVPRFVDLEGFAAVA